VHVGANPIHRNLQSVPCNKFRNTSIKRLENKCGTLGLLVTTMETVSIFDSRNPSIHVEMPDAGKNVPQLEVLASLESQLCLGLALCALQSQHNLLGGLCLLVEHGLCLTTITTLLSVVTTLSLGEQRGLSITQVRFHVFFVVGCELVRGKIRTFPALYWVTLCWVCFLQSLPLQ